jgi:RNA polymerase sigma-70 factor (ECF subfamily)
LSPTEANLRDMSERELLSEAERGSSASFGVVAERYRGRLLRFLATRKLPPADAEDVAQETFARAYARLDRYDGSRPFAAWLFAIAARLAATHWRRRRAEVAAGAFEPSDRAAGDPAAEAARADERTHLWAEAREQLSQRQYTALWLRYAEEQPVKQVAKAMRLTAIHVKVLLHRARRRLLASPAFARFDPAGRTTGQAPQRGAT